MSKEGHPFMPKQAEECEIYEYLGSDSFPIADTYNLYLQLCHEFRTKARKYARHNLLLKNSILHHNKCGYVSSEELEEEVLLERENQLKMYKENFNMTSFDEDLNSMYECYTGKSKRIRIIRDINQKTTEKFTSDFDNKQLSWFTRYCILSRFIQGARNIILLRRLEKALAILRILTPEKIQEIENEMAREKENNKTSEELALK